MKISGAWALGASISITSLIVISACSSGPKNVATGGGTSTGTGGTSTSSASASSSGVAAQGGAGGLGGASVDAGDAGDAADDVVFSDAPWDGGKLFDCNGCTCNGATHLCRGVSSGSPPPPPYNIDCVDGGDLGCSLIPPQCMPSPTCACISAQFGCGCYADDGYFDVICAVP